MAHFAEIDDTNNVLRVLVVPDEQEHRGQEFLADDLGLGGTWIQTSYNTHSNVHVGEDGEPDGGTPLRSNYASVGGVYDPINDVFHAQRPVEINGVVCDLWTIGAPAWQWEPPTPQPVEGFSYWDENEGDWIAPPEPPGDGYRWDTVLITWMEVEPE